MNPANARTTRRSAWFPATSANTRRVCRIEEIPSDPGGSSSRDGPDAAVDQRDRGHPLGELGVGEHQHVEPGDGADRCQPGVAEAGAPVESGQLPEEVPRTHGGEDALAAQEVCLAVEDEVEVPVDVPLTQDRVAFL